MPPAVRVRLPPLAALPDEATGAWLESYLELRAEHRNQELLKRFQTDLVLRFAAAERTLVRLNRELQRRQDDLDADLRAAADIQRALLPRRPPRLAGFQIDWQFVPSERVGGDVLLAAPLGPHHLQLAVVDVSGHGVPSAMVTVSICQALLPRMGVVVEGDLARGGTVVRPAAVVAALDREFPYLRFKKTFSIIYGLLDHRSGEFTFTNAGHPPPLVVGADGVTRFLPEHGAIIGMGLDDDFPEVTVKLSPGERLYLYTDGLTEARAPDGRLFGDDRLQRVSAEVQNTPLPAALASIRERAAEFQQRPTFHDDFTLLAVAATGA